jgi:hypothetical protein
MDVDRPSSSPSSIVQSIVQVLAHAKLNTKTIDPYFLREGKSGSAIRVHWHWQLTYQPRPHYTPPYFYSLVFTHFLLFWLHAKWLFVVSGYHFVTIDTILSIWHTYTVLQWKYKNCPTSAVCCDLLYKFVIYFL